MTRTYRFVQVDVFTRTPFRGNPLAVVLDADGLTDDDMLDIAREMNLSETTFVLPATHPDCAARVRIFTPGGELPFAGHPTLGTAWVLATRGLLPGGRTDIALQENIGPVPVQFEGTDPISPEFVWMDHPDAQFLDTLDDPAPVLRALGLDADDVLPDVPARVVMTGVPFLFLALRDREAVDRATPNATDLATATSGVNARGVFLTAPDGTEVGVTRVYSRMFAGHTLAIPEDPATGGASGPLGAYLTRYGLAPRGNAAIVSEQGTKMGRQSFLHIQVRDDGRTATGIRVGGAVVPVLEGVLTVPAGKRA